MTECSPGFFGLNCSTPCSENFYGKKCLSQCNCDKETHHCHHVCGCLPKLVIVSNATVINDSTSSVNGTSSYSTETCPTTADTRQTEALPSTRLVEQTSGCYCCYHDNLYVLVCAREREYLWVCRKGDGQPFEYLFKFHPNNGCSVTCSFNLDDILQFCVE